MIGTMSEIGKAMFDELKADTRIGSDHKISALQGFLKQVEAVLSSPHATEYQKQVSMAYKGRICADIEEYEGMMKGGG